MSTVEYVPEQPGPLVTMHACWMADNGFETAVFASRDEAVDFCVKRWGAPPRKIVGPSAGGVPEEGATDGD